ncbi:helix-turn-helix domain-containing protein [Niveispirillum sp. SYP-B3756]|uniref:helix-turn-helix domain-containing protein n=1 Tax=Niveispirillum sp. SYP-B3756 TaxID=2662178 RepID=UPI001564524F|nr:helix-turn-helix domain-containing protein [Niveispirillum sp. SYP-B3756]
MADHQGRSQDMRDKAAGATAEPQPAGGPRHVGEWLRQQREALGYGLPELAAGLRIRQHYLEAIEQGRWGELPGQAYTVGFLRTYAQTVGLDAGAVLLRFKQDAAGQNQAQELYFPEPVNESRVPGGAVLLIAALLGLLVYGGWYALSASDRSVGDLVPELPERLSKLIYGEQLPTPPPPPAPTTTQMSAGQVEALVGSSSPTAPEIGASNSPSSPTLPQASLAGTAADAGMPATDTSPAAQTGDEESEVPQLPDLGQGMAPPPPADPAVPEAEPVVTTDAAQPTAATAPKPAGTADVPPSGRIYGLAEGNVRLTIRALEDSWIEVRDGKGTLWASRVLRRGDLFRAPDVPGLVLNTGNAGGLLVTLDGRDLAPLGAKSQVMRGVPLTPEALANR